MLPSELWHYARKYSNYKNAIKVGSPEHKMCARILTYINHHFGYTAYAKCRTCGKNNHYHVVYYGWSKLVSAKELNDDTDQALAALDALVAGK